MFARAPSLALSLSLSLLVATACGQDLGPIGSIWSGMLAKWNQAVAESKAAAGDLRGKVESLPAVDAADEKGKELKAKVDAALQSHAGALAELERVMNATNNAVSDALATEKIKPVQEAIDSGKAKWSAAQKELSDVTTTAGGAYNDLKAHLDARVKAANAEAEQKAQAVAADEAVAKSEGAVDLPMVFDDKNNVDVAQSGPSVDRLLRITSVCEELKLEFTGSGPNAKAGKARAESVKKLLGKNGARVAKVAGKAGDGALGVKVAKPCP